MTGRGPDPRIGGLEEARLGERASATPVLEAEGQEASLERPYAGPPTPASLVELQQFFQEVIAHPGGASEGFRSSLAQGRTVGAKHPEELVTRGKNISAIKRLGLYRYAYFARLRECLEEDFPAVRWVVGDRRFSELARSYAVAYPSSYSSLVHFGRDFARFLREQGEGVPQSLFLAELAELEWGMIEVLHARDAGVIEMSTLGALPKERWEDIRFEMSDTFRFFDFRFPVNQFFQAYREDSEPSVPLEARSFVGVYRHEYRVWRLPFSAAMASVMKSLVAGHSLGSALSVLQAREDAGEDDVMRWFSSWVGSGFFRRISVERGP